MSGISESSDRLKAELTLPVASGPRKWQSKTQGTAGGKIPGNNMQTGWEEVRELKWKWSMQSQHVQTQGHSGTRMTIFTQKPVVRSGNEASGAFRCKNVMQCDVKNKMIISNILQGSWHLLRMFLKHHPHISISPCWRNVGAEHQGRNAFCSWSPTGKWRNQTFSWRILFAKDSSGSMLLGDLQSKEDIRDLPVVNNPPCDSGWIPSQGTKISHALEQLSLRHS